MGAKQYPDGISDFKSMVSGDYFFVDKTMLIEDVCKAENKTLLYARPRRFGKSTNLSMLDHYFGIRYKGGPDIFKGLKIDSCERCRPHKNRYPVIRMNFDTFDGRSRERFIGSLNEMLSQVAKDALKDMENEHLRPYERSFLEKAVMKQMDEVEVQAFVGNLCRLYQDVYNEKTMVLVDEYDRCIQNIRSSELFTEITETFRQFMENSFKFNPFIRTSVITGIMPLAKTSMLSSFNNSSVCSVLDPMGDEFFGFTEEEVIRLVEETGNPPEKMNEIRDWYNGYHFGNADVYNPYSVILYLQNECRPEAYWNNMTGGGMSTDLISSMGTEALDALRGLYEDPASCLVTPIDVRISYFDVLSPTADPSVVYSYLAMAGYLKAVRT
ncbi:MAG: AAA family ATPase, partial [Candidatus Methanomethylophilaceae archaeon]|nr:AAA family ATPase [Candidatus Methanomethylophilaceae archaeon]